MRRHEILAAAVELIREEGLWSVHVSDVAERAGTSRGTVIYYFGTKNQLLEEAIADADAEFYARLWPELDTLDCAVDRIVRVIVRSSTIEWVLWMDHWTYARRQPVMLAPERGFHGRWCTTIADVIRYGQTRGEFSAVDPDRVAIRLGALTDRLAIRLVLEAEFAREDYVDLSLEAVAAELGCGLDALRQAACSCVTW
jgi:TetR/AcrR family transcriptional regulator, transcriptional repressor of bet genes